MPIRHHLRLCGSFNHGRHAPPTDAFTPLSWTTEHPIKRIHSASGGGSSTFIMETQLGLFGFGHNHRRSLAVPFRSDDPFILEPVRPRFQTKPEWNIVGLRWLKMCAWNTFAYVNMKTEQGIKPQLMACGTTTGHQLGTEENFRDFLDTFRTLDSLNQMLPEDSTILNIECLGASTLVWARDASTHEIKIFGSGLNAHQELATIRGAIRQWTDLTQEYQRDMPLEETTFIDAKRMVTCTLVLASNGRVYARGEGKNGELGGSRLASPHLVHVELPLDLGERVERIFSGPHHALALTNHQRLFEWGAGNYVGKVIRGMGSTDRMFLDANRFPIRQIPPEQLGIEPSRNGQRDAGEESIVDVQCGANMTYVITSKGRIISSGSNGDSQMGVHLDTLGSVEGRSDPRLPTLGEYKDITQYLIPNPGEKLRELKSAGHCALIWTDEEV